ncbi:hypothetical protein BDQ94DRAFT_72814 [Aspergillus welwitschiae]|uniref:Uncharacterized protein n=1 Tax=Aspergillus welwitschiae TaxID=1341132 RepID=A0A3F3QFV7_9EURO|nr:hypothetical protein BDQ94DRAFT_72814 [Aspergillus welwitschiae]RDH38051.1 hypothetical protein BDQ94DRAFT_72814 [Aspergillus welwitschiae]
MRSAVRIRVEAFFALSLFAIHIIRFRLNQRLIAVHSVHLNKILGKQPYAHHLFYNIEALLKKLV